MRQTLLHLPLLAAPAFAAQSAEDFQWTFDAACLHSQPALIERGAEELAGNIGLQKLEAADVNAAWMGDNGMMMMVDGTPLETTCIIALPQSEIADNAATLAAAIGERIAAKAKDSPVTETSEEGVTSWAWVRDDVSFEAEVEARDGHYTLSLVASR
ncbi:MAG: hypothetical protein RIG84_14740 [Roseovarius sp.]